MEWKIDNEMTFKPSLPHAAGDLHETLETKIIKHEQMWNDQHVNYKI